MILKLFSVFDRKAEVYLPPMYYLTVGQAVRDFTDALNGDTPMAKHPEDYTLYEVGFFDDHEVFVGVVPDAPVSIVGGSSVVLPRTGGV